MPNVARCLQSQPAVRLQARTFKKREGERTSVFVGDVGVGAKIEEEEDDLREPRVRAGAVEWGVAVLVNLVNWRPRSHEHLYHRQLAVPGGPVKRRIPIKVLCGQVGA